jgi:hypothetical protein
MPSGPGSGRGLVSPQIQFPVYGLDPSWPGARWLELFGDEIGDPLRWVSLGHRSRDGDALVVVKTYARRAAGAPRSYQIPTDAQAAELGRSPLEWVAFSAAVELINLTLPVRSLPRPPGFNRALADRAGQAGQEYGRWPAVRWSVDGQAVTAHRWRFAGGWAAFTDAVEGVYLYATGLGTDPDGLSLSVLQDGGGYHFALDQPLWPEALSAARAAAGVDELAELRAVDWHPDQLRLMRDR